MFQKGLIKYQQEGALFDFSTFRDLRNLYFEGLRKRGTILIDTVNNRYINHLVKQHIKRKDFMPDINFVNQLEPELKRKYEDALAIALNNYNPDAQVKDINTTVYKIATNKEGTEIKVSNKNVGYTTTYKYRLEAIRKYKDMTIALRSGDFKGKEYMPQTEEEIISYCVEKYLKECIYYQQVGQKDTRYLYPDLSVIASIYKIRKKPEDQIITIFDTLI